MRLGVATGSKLAGQISTPRQGKRRNVSPRGGGLSVLRYGYGSDAAAAVNGQQRSSEHRCYQKEHVITMLQTPPHTPPPPETNHHPKLPKPDA
jgi:hypothetical protein